MRRCILLTLSLLILGPAAAFAQNVADRTTPVEGLRDNAPGLHALTNVEVVVAPGTVVEGATVVIRGGVIEQVGTDVSVPAGARVWDLEGHTVYAGFIDPHSDVGMGEPRTEDTHRGPAYWNPQIQSFISAANEYVHDDDRTGELRAQGIGAALAVPQLGIFRGETALVSLGEGPDNRLIISSGQAQSVSYSRSNDLSGGYPTSLMGSIALIRQTLYDTDWYREAQAVYRSNPQGLDRPETNRSLEALDAAARGQVPLLFEARNQDELQWTLTLSEEFPIDVWIRGDGNEYQILDVVSQMDAPLIIPVDFPERPDLSNPDAALGASVAMLRNWYLAPENPARLAGEGVEFAFTADGLDDAEDYLANIRTAVTRGLDREVALAALTTVPAGMVGAAATHGTVEAGKVANLVVTDGDLFDDGAVVRDVWVDGRRYPIDPAPAVDVRGDWVVTAPDGPTGPVEGRLALEGSRTSPSGTLTVNGQSVELRSASVRADARRVRFQVPGEALEIPGVMRFSATLSGDELHGWGEMPDGSRLNWHGQRTAEFQPAENGENRARRQAAELDLPDLRPALDFGREALPDQPEHVLVQGATIWTMGPQGILEDADLLVREGRVVEVGPGLEAPADAQVIDAAGKHVTPGLIDAHIHSGSGGGINETGSAIVPEVRLGDVVTANNAWMYRQLAGGLTTAHLMHGSANPIGGQNVHMKMRWGALPHEQKLEGAPRTVKFALGENVKRRTERYPDTRMGTEQIIRDHFKAAREYEARWADWEAGGDGIPPRRDLRMEALVDIMNGDILIQAHSYRQDEILMLMRVAEEFDVTIDAFHHGVEAYKVAPELREHGAAAVVWSDWGGFKIEAYDNTLYNARLLNEEGVVTSLHSDNSEIAARMHWEAAKVVRSGVDEEDALAMVTINTARALGIDHLVGSLEEGKDADFVIWSESPVSQFTRAEQTWVDGRRYFDLDENRELERRVEDERSRLVQFILNNSR